MVPQRRTMGVFDPARPAPGGSARLDDALPTRGRVGDARGEPRLALSLAGIAPVLARRWVEQAGVLAAV